MSITGFEDAISDNVKSYSNNLDALRATNVMARNNALAGIQSEVEKYGEMAKLGLEIPVAVEGLKQVGGRAKDLVNFVRGAPAKLEEAKGAINTALSQGRQALTEGVSSARGAVGGAVGDIRDTLTQRLDNLRTTSAYGGRPLQPGEQMGSLSDLAGETKVEFNPTERIRQNMMRSTTRGGSIEMSATDDPNYFETKSGGSSFAYGDGRRFASNSDAMGGDDFEGFDNTDKFGLPLKSQAFGEGEPSLFSHEEPRFSTQRGLDAGFGNDRVGIGNMGRAPQAPVRQRFSEYSTTAPEAQETKTGGIELSDMKPGRGRGDYQDIGEDRGAGASYAPPSQGQAGGARAGESKMDTSEEQRVFDRSGGETKGEEPDGIYSSAAKQTAGAEGSSAGSIGDDAGKLAGDVVDSAAASTGGEVAGGLEEGLGAGLLASGIFAPLGALLEGIGAVTEVGSVAAGAYGAVQSFSEAGAEEALRNKPMPTINRPALDLGGRVAAPILA
tara:strand:+ start:3476 stop:4972 length:1497 start_codon:yes stop_codon:yes gene_type:complete